MPEIADTPTLVSNTPVSITLVGITLVGITLVGIALVSITLLSITLRQRPGFTIAQRVTAPSGTAPLGLIPSPAGTWAGARGHP